MDKICKEIHVFKEFDDTGSIKALPYYGEQTLPYCPKCKCLPQSESAWDWRHVLYPNQHQQNIPQNK